MKAKPEKEKKTLKENVKGTRFSANAEYPNHSFLEI